MKRIWICAAALLLAGTAGALDSSELKQKKSAGTTTQKKDTQPIILPGMIHNISFHSQIVLTNGTLGYAQSNAFGTGARPTSYGKIFIYGLTLTQGNVWTGIVYPTNRTIPYRGENYPCCALSAATAQRIDALQP